MAYKLRKTQDSSVESILHGITGQPEKVCFRAIERAVSRGLLDYGVCITGAWITDKGIDLLGDKAGVDALSSRANQVKP